MCQMKIKQKRKKREMKAAPLPVIREDAAGIDIGATLIHVAVGPGRDEEPVRTFETFTRDLKAIVLWLQAVRVKTVAMESTGVYWIPLYELLESEGFEVLLVNAQPVKHVPGRKSAVSDAQWLPYLHSVGLLQGSFRPAEAICAIRSMGRHRESLVQAASACILMMQKALTQMNRQWHNVIRIFRKPARQRDQGYPRGDQAIAGRQLPFRVGIHSGTKCNPLQGSAEADRGLRERNGADDGCCAGESESGR